MDDYRSPDEDFSVESDEIIAFLLNFAIGSYQLIKKEDANGLLSLCKQSAGQIYAYGHGKSLTSELEVPEKHRKHGWRMV